MATVGYPLFSSGQGMGQGSTLCPPYPVEGISGAVRLQPGSLC